MKKSLIALGFGTLCLGIAEFVMMAILPYVAADLRVSIPTAGHLISAYALGVCFGAPVLTLVRRYPLKRILLCLVAVMMAGNLLAAVSPSYGLMLVARFVSGLPHGAYFGVGSIVAARLADEGKGTQAVSIMIAGMTVANLFGVPLGSSVGALLSWRVAFLFVGGVGLLTLYYIWKWVPPVEGLPDAGFKGQFRFLRTPAPWLIFGATMLGNGAVFCWYSYVHPQLTAVSGFAEEAVSMLMVLAGFGMVVGNLVSGRLSDRFTPGRVAAATEGVIVVALLAIYLLSPVRPLMPLLLCTATAGLFAVSGPLQVSIIRFAPGGELLGAACIQVAFNLGNAVGAALGGLPIDAGLGYRMPALIGVPMALVGLVLLLVFVKRYETPALRKV